MRSLTFSFSSCQKINAMLLYRFKAKEKIRRSVLMNAKNYFIKEHLSIRNINFSKDVKIEAEK